MHENKFEKHIQEKMEELSFSPSPEVWQKVEAEIRKKKDRRRIVLWFFFLALLAGGAGYWLFTNKEFPKQTVSINKQNQTTGLENTNIKTPIVRNKNENVPNAKTKTTVTKTPTVIATVSEKKVQQTSPKKTFISKHKNDKELLVNDENRNKVNNSTSIIKSEDKNIVTKKEIGDLTNESEKVVAKIPPIKNDDSLLKTITNDTSKTSLEIAKTDSTQINKKAEVNKKKWVWSIVMRSGMAGIKGGIFSNSDKNNTTYAAAPSTSNGAGFSNPNPVKVKNGFAFSAGIGLQKELKKRLSITSGLHYSFYTTQMRVGKVVQRDTTIQYAAANRLSLSNYFTNDQQGKTYTNHYHFIELPIGLSYQLLKNVPLRLDGSVVYSQLISTDALLYNRNANIFYADKKGFQKAGLQLAAGINYTILKNKKANLLVGPHLQYSITRLAKEKTSLQQYLYFAGLQARITF